MKHWLNGIIVVWYPEIDNCATQRRKRGHIDVAQVANPNLNTQAGRLQQGSV